MKNLLPPYLRVPLLFFAFFGALEYFIDSGDQPAFVKYPIVILGLAVFLVLLIACEMVISAADNITYHLLTPEERAKLDAEPSWIPIAQRDWYKKLMQKLTRTEPVENEAAILLHHDYDGIKELDNNLPPWWIYLFFGTIVFGAIYLARFEFLGGDNQEAEFSKEMAVAKIAIEEYKKNAPDQMNEDKVTLLTDKSEIAIGKAIFQNNCIPCHRADAGGQIGPNLTDDHWILGGGIKNIFHTITNGGRDGKGMVAWGGTLKPTEIQHVASYVISLQGSNPKDPKAPDGDVWIEAKNISMAGTAK